MRRLIWLIPIVVAVAWCAWTAWRWQALRAIYADPQEPALTITPQHVEALRKLRFAWNTRIESGGPIVDPLAPYGSADMAADLGPIIGTGDRLAIARFHREVSVLLISRCGIANSPTDNIGSRISTMPRWKGCSGATSPDCGTGRSDR